MTKAFLVAACVVFPLFVRAAEKPAEQADEPVIEKSQYNLFHPTPDRYLREMSTDRPDKTESAYTIDAGHFQLEMDLVSYAFDRGRSNGADTRVDAWAIAPINFKVGLNNRVDLQTVIETYNVVTTDDRGARRKRRQSGFGDVANRLKVNIWGDDGGPTAFAVMPFVKYPTSQDSLGNRSVEGGLILPLAVALPAQWNMGVMTQLNVNRANEGSGHCLEFVNSLTMSHDIVGELAGYMELFSAVSTDRHARWVGTFDLGLTYGLTKNIQLDAGVNIGVTDSADDLNPFLGLSWRF